MNRTGWWLCDWFFIGFCLFRKDYRLIAADLSKQKVLDTDSKAIQQITFIGTVKTTLITYYIFGQ